MTTQQHTPTPSYDTRKHVKCLVHDCTNHTDEGGFIGALCVPCYRMVTTQNARRACNAHDSLVAALEAAMAYARDEAGKPGITWLEGKAHEALKLARGEP